MASITKISTGYRVRWRVHGKSRSKTLGTLSAAQSFRRTVEAAEHQGTAIDPRSGRLSLAQWHADWTAGRLNLRPSTRAKNANLWRYIEPTFGHAQLGKITQQQVQRWISDLSKSDLAAATVRMAYAHLATCLKAAVNAGILQASPCKSISLPAVERHEMTVLDHDEIAALAESIEPRYRALVLVLAYGGLRIGEATALRRRDFTDGALHVRRTAYGSGSSWHTNEPKTAAGRRTVPLPATIARELSAHVEAYAGPGPDALIFTTKQGKPIDRNVFRARPFARACEKAGVDVRLHDLRHTAISLWARAAIGWSRIIEWAGHTDPSFTIKQYAQYYPQDNAAVLADLDARLTNARVG